MIRYRMHIYADTANQELLEGLVDANRALMDQVELGDECYMRVNTVDSEEGYDHDLWPEHISGDILEFQDIKEGDVEMPDDARDGLAVLLNRQSGFNLFSTKENNPWLIIVASTLVPGARKLPLDLKTMMQLTGYADTITVSFFDGRETLHF